MKRKNLDKRTLKWCARQLRKMEVQAFGLSRPRGAVDSTGTPSRNEMLGRSIMLGRIANDIREGRKT